MRVVQTPVDDRRRADARADHAFAARHQHQRHEAAIAVADHADTIGIHPRLTAQVADARELIGYFDVCKSTANRILERLGCDWCRRDCRIRIPPFPPRQTAGVSAAPIRCEPAVRLVRHTHSRAPATVAPDPGRAAASADKRVPARRRRQSDRTSAVRAARGTDDMDAPQSACWRPVVAPMMRQLTIEARCTAVAPRGSSGRRTNGRRRRRSLRANRDPGSVVRVRRAHRMRCETDAVRSVGRSNRARTPGFRSAWTISLIRPRSPLNATHARVASIQIQLRRTRCVPTSTKSRRRPPTNRKLLCRLIHAGCCSVTSSARLPARRTDAP